MTEHSPLNLQNYIKVGPVDDLAEGSMVDVWTGTVRLAVFRHLGKFFALEDRCPHRGAPLSGGHFEHGTVTCSWHGWEFDVRSGHLVGDNACRIPRHRLAVCDGVLFVERTPDGNLG